MKDRPRVQLKTEELRESGKEAARASAEKYCDKLIAAFEKKSKHNKREALWLFVAVIVSTISVPIFIHAFDSAFWSKFIPSALSAVAAGATTWLQVRKPQQLWGIYRTAQRELEDHKTRYTHRLAPYGNDAASHKLFVEQAADIAIGIHYEWLPLVPNVNQVNPHTASGAPKVRRAKK